MRCDNCDDTGTCGACGNSGQPKPRECDECDGWGNCNCGHPRGVNTYGGAEESDEGDTWDGEMPL
jgi:hypothetical protein